MPPQLALLIATAFVFFAFRSDKKRGVAVSKELFWPCLWYLVVASRPVGVWLDIWGIHFGSEETGDGSLIDRSFYAVLTVIGLKVLSGRKFDWGATLRRNRWLTAFFIFMAISILWSQYPYISFKRYIKVIGSLVMACVVLTEKNPLEAFGTVLRRCLYVHLPMSIVCTRYYREIGVSYDWSGTGQAWQGISSTKNTLGQICMLGVVYFYWEIQRNWKRFGWKNLHVVYLFMALYLMKGPGAASVSMTAVSVAVFALVTFIWLQMLKARPAAARGFGLLVFGATSALILFVVTHSIVMFSEDSIFGHIITALGRDITMTDRTYIWSDVYAKVKNPWLGVGVGGFWIGRMANIPWNTNMTWVLGQAHSGYVDTYLQLGWIGCFLLAGVLVSSVRRTLDELATDFEFASFRVTILLTVVFINMTESTYLRGDHHLWLLMQIAVWSVVVKGVPKRNNPPKQSVPDATAQPAARTLPTYYA